MPHCIVEHSSDLNSNLFLEPVLKGCIASSVFAGKEENIKLRAVPYEHFLLNDGSERFVHVSLKILSGRTDEQKALLSQAVLAQLQTLNLSQCVISVEVEDLHLPSYAKYSS